MEGEINTLDAAFERVLRGALPVRQSLPGKNDEPYLPVGKSAGQCTVAHRQTGGKDVIDEATHRRSKAHRRDRLSVPKPFLCEAHLGQWLRNWNFLQNKPGELPFSPWRSSTPSALLGVQSLIAQHKWGHARELMCDLCFLSEYMQTFGLGQLLDLFELARIAASLSKAQDAMATFGEWERFAQKLRGCGKLADRLSFLIQKAQQVDESLKIRDASKNLLDSVRACISLTEERLMMSPPRIQRATLVRREFSGVGLHASAGSREHELASAVKTLQAFHSLGGSESLSRPWRARLVACCDAVQSGTECKCCGLSRRSLAPCCEHLEPRLDQDDIVEDCKKGTNNQHQVRGGVTVGAAGTQDAVVEAVMGQMRQRTACRVRLVGPAGCGKSSLLAMVAGRLQEVCATSGRVVYLCKMAWQSERQFMRVLVREVVEDEGADADAMSLRDALRLLDASRRLFLIVDGLSAEEQDMLSATLLYSGTECLVSLATAISTEPRQEAGSDHMIAVGRLTRPEQYAILKSRAADLALELSLEDLEEIAAKQDATSPQYLILALHYINLRRHVAHAGPAIPHLPARTADLIASDAGLLALLEQKHGKQVVKYAGCCLAYFPAVCSRDVVKLCQLQGITTTLEGMSLIMHQLHALSVSCILQLPSAGNQVFYAMESKVIGKAVLERYGFIHHNGLEMARTRLVQLLHLNVETDARRLRGLVQNLRHMPNSGRLLQVGSLLEAEDALINQPEDFRCAALAYLCLRPALAVSQMASLTHGSRHAR